MQLDLPFLRTPVHEPPIDFVRVPRARKYILRVRPDGTLRVTIPRGGSRAEAVRFVERHLHWVVAERLRVAEQHAPRRWAPGTAILYEGVPVPLAVSGTTIVYADRRILLRELPDDLRPAVEADLRAVARERLVPRLMELAARHGIAVARVSIRNQRSRWGSCSREGRIALNFRLVQMPADVRDYVLVHELMHVRQQNHGPRFWRLVAAAFPAYRDAERWLRQQGRRLF